MSEHENDLRDTTDEPLDPREQMKAALDAKQAHARQGEEHADGKGKGTSARGPLAGKRQFRRKSGG